jgi:protocatechuate 4,5-dioxygenase beta chain
MAECVEIIGVTHSPPLGTAFEEDPDIEPGIRAALENYHLMGRKLDAARPDAIIVIASDHLNQFFMDNMPAFLVGKAARAGGPFPPEMRSWKLRPFEAEIDTDLAKRLVADGFNKGVDFAYADEFMIDHAFTMPMSYIRPAGDVPIVPIFTNVMAPPVPPSQRFYDVGVAIRNVIDDMPGQKRVAVVVSGHMAVEVGGPKARSGSTDPEFDHQMMALLAEGDAPGLVREATWERMSRAGNVASGFSNYVMMAGIARGATPDYADANYTKSRATAPFVAWDLAH